jgi:hypothetical protein
LKTKLTCRRVLEGREDPTRGPARSLSISTLRMLQRKMRFSTIEAQTGMMRTIVKGLSLIQHLNTQTHNGLVEKC